MTKRLAFILVLFCAPAMWGAAISSNAGSNLNWNAGGTWVGGVVPGSGDTVTIVTASSVIVTDTEAASTITTAGTGNIDVQSGGKITTTTTTVLAGTGGVTVEGGGTYYNGTNITIGYGTTFHVTGNNASSCGVLWENTGATSNSNAITLSGSGSTVGALTVDSCGHLYMAAIFAPMRSTAINLYGPNPLTFCTAQAAASTICNTTGTPTALQTTEANTSATLPMQFNICPTAACNTWATTLTPTTVGTFRSGTCSTVATVNQLPANSGSHRFYFRVNGNNPNVVFNCATFSGVSDATHTNITLQATTAGEFATGQSWVWQGVTFNHSGPFVIDNVGVGTVVVDGLTVINPVDTGTATLISIHAAPSTYGSDLFQQIVGYNEPTEVQPVNKPIRLDIMHLCTTGSTAGNCVRGADTPDCGQSVREGDAYNIPCFMGYNVGMGNNTVTNSVGLILHNVSIVVDNTNNGALCGSYGNNNSDQFQTMFAYLHFPNQHCWVDGVNTYSGTGAANSWKDIWVDGDGLFFADTGNNLIYNGKIVIQNFTGFNSAGEPSSTSGNSNITNGMGGTLHNYTLYRTSGIGTTGAASINNKFAFYSLTDMLVVLPWNLQLGPGTFPKHDQGGLNCALDGALNICRQVALTALDYNVFWQMPCSGTCDPGADTLSASGTILPLSNPLVGTAAGYIVPGPSGVALLQSAKTTTSGTTSTNVACTGCTFSASGVIAGDWLCKEGPPSVCDSITTVNSDTQITLTTGITGLVSGNTIDVYAGYVAAANVGISGPAIYGVTANYGTHDKHINPNFRNPTDTTCQWLVRNGLVASTICPHLNANLVGSSSTTSDIKTGGVDPTGWGITLNVDQLYIWQTSTQLRCVGTITNVTATDITITPEAACGSPTTTDAWTISPATRALGRAWVQLNGIAYDGTANHTFNTALDPAVWEQQLDWDFTPMNGQLRNTMSATFCATQIANGSCDPGAKPVFNPTVMVQ